MLHFERNDMAEPKLTNEQRNQVVVEYLSGDSTPKIAKKYEMHPSTILRIIKKRGVQMRPPTEHHRKYKINENYFDNIDNQEKSYLLGLLYADGSHNNKYSIKLQLQEKDKDILLKFRDLISTDKPLGFVKSKSIKHQNSYLLNITNQHVATQLDKFGTIRNKSLKATFPNWLKSELIPHFIRGYMDGDGCICVDKKRNRGHIGIEGTESFLKSITDITKLQLNINTNISTRHPENNNTNRSLQISGNFQVLKFLNWIYKDQTICLLRKYKKYLELIEISINIYERKHRVCEICGKPNYGHGLCRLHYDRKYQKEQRARSKSSPSTKNVI